MIEKEIIKLGYYGNSPYGVSPYNFNQPQNYQQTLQSTISQNNLIKVTGINGAKAYQMQPNGAVALFDDSNDIFYIKTTDGANFPTIRAFQFSEVKEAEPQQIDYVTRKEFNELKEMLNNGKQPVSEKQSKKSKQSTANDSAV